MKMTDHIETCPDYHHCLNGSKCVENPYKQGAYYCDCDEVVFDVHYEGLFCEHKAETYCYSNNQLNEHWFCTNGGTCSTEKSEPSKPKWGCDCPEEYEGSYCQFVKGTKPKGYPYTTQKVQIKSNSGTLVGVVIGSLVTAIVIVSVAFAILFRRRNQREVSRGTKARGENLELDPDGSLLKVAVVKSTERGGSKVDIQDKTQDRPDTRQSDAGISYADEMMSFT